MKKMFFILCALLFISPVSAQEQQSEPAQLGTIAGLAMACGGGKQLYTYEEITSRLLSNTAANEKIEKSMYLEYARAKADSFREQSTRKRVSCNEIMNSFYKMPIFKFELYVDGSLKTPEGRYLLPRGQKKFNPSVERVYPETPQMPQNRAAQTATQPQRQLPAQQRGTMQQPVPMAAPRYGSQPAYK